MSAHLTPEALRELFLFADLDDDKLDWVAEHGDVVDYPAGAVVSAEGACFLAEPWFAIPWYGGPRPGRGLDHSRDVKWRWRCAQAACGSATPSSASRVTMPASRASSQPSVPAGRIGSTIHR